MKKAEFFRKILETVRKINEIPGTPTDEQMVAAARSKGIPLPDGNVLSSLMGGAILGAWSYPNNSPAIVAAFEGAWEEYEALPAEKKKAA